jgi:hypothetical protein
VHVPRPRAEHDIFDIWRGPKQFALWHCFCQPDAWLCREGLARFATVPYASPSAANLDQQFMHLTNYSLNKVGGAGLGF